MKPASKLPSRAQLLTCKLAIKTFLQLMSDLSMFEPDLALKPIITYFKEQKLKYNVRIREECLVTFINLHC